MRLRLAIPTLNAATFLEEALRSVRLCWPEAEVCIVDSGSTDETRAIARANGALLMECPPGNLYAAVNTALLGCGADWVGYLNADDRIDGRVRLEGDVAYGDQTFISSSSERIYRWRMANPGSFGPLLAHGVMPLYFQGSWVRGQVFDHMGGFDLRYRWSADFDFVVRAWKAGVDFRRTKNWSGAFRLHGAQITQSRAAAMRIEVMDSVERSGISQTVTNQRAALAWLRIRNAGGLLGRVVRHGLRRGTWLPTTTDPIEKET
jgi:glycosyltransferase involved in cell wall biosynthesis